MKTLRIACRDSLLAVAQAHVVMQAIRNYDPLVVPELIPLKTPADEMAHLPNLPPNMKRAHLAPLEELLRSGRVELVVHCLKDLPTDENPELPLVAVGARSEARDVIVISSRREEPDTSRPIGVSCQRRRVQIKNLFPTWKTGIINGDIMARLAALDSGIYGALVLSGAALIALRRQDRIHQTFSVGQMIPTCCQGIIAVQGRAREPVGFLAGFHDVDAWDMSLAERAFMRTIGGGDDAMAAACATVRGDKLNLHGMLADDKGKMWEGVLSGRREDAVQVGAALAARLMLDAAGPRAPRQSPESPV